jgi:hypothetical protein
LSGHGREVPILFRADMVRAILAGTKTQTRRLVKPQPPLETTRIARVALMPPAREGRTHDLLPAIEAGPITFERLRPRWQAGDLLWVRETWRQADDPSSCYHYRADLDEPEAPGCWRSPIHLDRFGSRIDLRALSVEPQRVQDITEEDAKAEGVAPFFERFTEISREQRLTSGELAADAPHRASFAVLWDEINDGEGTRWKDNPWVWRIAFAVVKPSRKGAA